MPAQRTSQSASRKPTTRLRAPKPAAPGNKLAAAQAAEAMHRLAASGVLTGRADKVSARLDHGLLQAAARKIGSTNTTEVVQAALAAFVAPDPFVEWLLSDKDRLPADFELAI
jgi:hypothetical protein